MKAVITGATKGLGAALAAELTEAGITVAGCGSRAAPGPYAAVDVTDADAMARWAATVGAPVDWVIANAAVSLPTLPAAGISATEFLRVLEVNVVGVLTAFTAFAPYAASNCVFLALSSRWGRTAPRPGQIAYCASKFAVEGLVTAWRQEIGPAQHAYAVDPGTGIDTAMNAAMAVPGPPTRPPVQLDAWAARAGRYVRSLHARPRRAVHLAIPGG